MPTAVVLVTAALGIAAMAPDAQAMRFQQRPHWLVGTGMGYGRGTFENPAGDRDAWHDGAIPQLRLGRTLGAHAMVGVHYDAWMIEFGEVPTKYRRILQHLGLGLTWYPGNPETWTGGAFLRASGGMGWIGFAEKEAIPGEAQGEGERQDEWGVGLGLGAGYEFWIARRFTAGLGGVFNYVQIDETLVDSAWSGGFVVDLNFYF